MWYQKDQKTKYNTKGVCTTVPAVPVAHASSLSNSGMYDSDFSVTTLPLPSSAPYSTLPCVLSFCCKFRSTGKTQPLLLAGNKQHKEIPKTERQNTQKRTLGKNKDQLHYNMHTQFMCRYISLSKLLLQVRRDGTLFMLATVHLYPTICTLSSCVLFLISLSKLLLQVRRDGDTGHAGQDLALPNNCTLYSLSLEPHPQNSQKHGRNKYIVF